MTIYYSPEDAPRPVPGAVVVLGDAELTLAPGGYWLTNKKTGIRYWVDDADAVPEPSSLSSRQ